MPKYYYIDANGQQTGPFNLNELVNQPITRQTYVWREGLSSWVMADQLPELAPSFNNVPPAYTQPSPHTAHGVSPTPPVSRPSTYLWLAILSTIFCCLPFGIVSIVYASKVDSYWAAGNYDEAIRNSNKAKNWGIAAAATGIGVSLFYFILLIS
ncbi:MAG: CD225/dispanin family protein, partial [Muribaculaceae bacterium]|nr:CD225/dispanin family protein [Muribaculaceae bacterium]